MSIYLHKSKAVGEITDKFKKTIKSRRGKNALTFAIFLVLSAVLWVVQSLNEEVQRDIRCSLKITNVPDSVTRVTPIPEAINVSVRARGTQLIKYWYSRTPEISLDYRMYKKDNKIQFGESAMRAFFRAMVGQGSQILSVSPDTLTVAFTTNPGVLLPVRSDVKVTPAPQYSLLGKPRLNVDSVKLYAVNQASLSKLRAVSTAHLVITDATQSQTLKVPLQTPTGVRAIPDSVDISYEVEPLISKMREVTVKPVNVPPGIRVIPVPTKVEVYYMVPMSIYKKAYSDPKFTVEADYSVVAEQATERIPVELVSVPKDFTNVFLSTDSVDYIIEQQ